MTRNLDLYTLLLATANIKRPQAVRGKSIRALVVLARRWLETSD